MRSAVTLDAYCLQLWEEAKACLAEAETRSGETSETFSRLALHMAVITFEAHLNAVCQEMSERMPGNALSTSVLLEQDVRLIDGEWKLVGEKFFRTLDRLEYLYKAFGSKPLMKEGGTWTNLRAALEMRNALTHPKAFRQVTFQDATRYLNAILEALNDLYSSLYGQGHPSFGRRLDTELDLC